MKKTTTAIVCVILLVCVFGHSIEAAIGVDSLILIAGLAVALIGATWLDGVVRDLTKPDHGPFLRRRPNAGGFDAPV